uniref:AlNc14C19G2007 protein n=1 Tax=Albugo laibachii Nc14 TaxID=890382 RepID=F0W536_9STRA|nr:AlNc14C19G2007 [Albugo laibachii Nc14]|eukprot:CCA16227.1 AlNc14C19G2007 [Albugo laibachii Nc14]
MDGANQRHEQFCKLWNHKNSSRAFLPIHSADPNLEFVIKRSLFEIYMEPVCNLMEPQNERIKLEFRGDTRRGFWEEVSVEAMNSSNIHKRRLRSFLYCNQCTYAEASEVRNFSSF